MAQRYHVCLRLKRPAVGVGFGAVEGAMLEAAGKGRRFGVAILTPGLVGSIGERAADSDALDELPYRRQETGMLVLPYVLDRNDMKFFHSNGFVLPDTFAGYVTAALDQLIEEGCRSVPRLLSVCKEMTELV